MKKHQKILLPLLGLALLATPLAFNQNAFAEDSQSYFTSAELESCVKDANGGSLPTQESPNDAIEHLKCASSNIVSADFAIGFLHTLRGNGLPNLQSINLVPEASSSSVTAFIYLSDSGDTFAGITSDAGLTYNNENLKQVFIFGDTSAHTKDFLQDYTNLEELAIRLYSEGGEEEAGSLQELDLSANTKLQSLDINGNSDLAKLTLPQTDTLTRVTVSYNNLSALDFTGITKLQHLDINESSLTSLELDSSKNTSLTYLSLGGSEAAVSKLDLMQHNPELEVIDIEGINSADEFDASENPKLEYVYIFDSKLAKILLYNSENLKSVWLGDVEGLKKLVLPASFASKTDEELADILYIYQSGGEDIYTEEDNLARVSELRANGVIVFGIDSLAVPKTGGLFIEPAAAATVSLAAATDCLVALGVIHFAVKNYRKVKFDK